MFYDMFVGEWRKIGGNLWATIFFVWIFPIITVLLVGLYLLVAIFSAEARTDLATSRVLGTWDSVAMSTWIMVNNEIGRWIIAAFTATVFAGEYQNGTWKNFVPHRPRGLLFLNKMFTVGVYVTFAWTMMAVIAGVGFGLVAAVAGAPYGEFNAQVIGEFSRDFSIQVFATLASTLIAACYAALASMLVRNIAPSIFIAILINMAETALVLPLALIDSLLNINLFGLYLLTPSYNIMNITNWLMNGVGVQPAFGDPMVRYGPNSLGGSILIVVLIVAALMSFTIWRFRKQDIVT